MFSTVCREIVDLVDHTEKSPEFTMMYRHKFHKESKEALREFMKACRSVEEYHEPKEKEAKLWAPFMKHLSLDKFLEENDPPSIKNKSNNHGTKDAEGIKSLMPHPSTSGVNIDLSEVEDIPKFYVHDLQKEPEERVQQVYRRALLILDLSGMLQVGESIMKIDPNNILVKYYCEEILFKMMARYFRDKLKKLFQELCYYDSLVTKHLAHFMKVHDKLGILFLYLNSKSSIEDAILREYLNIYEGPLTKKSLSVMETLIHMDTDFNSIKIVIDILSNHAVEFKANIDYGKLILTVIEGLGPNVESLKNQIDGILSIHESMWKTKINKLYNKHLEGI